MKKIIVSLVGFLSLTAAVNAQTDLYVDDASYMYVQNEVVFVTDGVRLKNGADAIATGSHIYLRDGAQLVQGNDVKNSDDGELSVYQEQTGGIYDYTYWCSPVGAGVDGATEANANFTPEANYRQPSSGAITETTSGQYMVNPTLWDTNASTIAGRWIWQAMNANSYANWSFVGNNASTVQAGAGYTQKGSPIPDDVIDFRGRPNSGTISIDCTPGGTPQAGYDGLVTNQVQMMVGNPYPSSMDLKQIFYTYDPVANTYTERVDNSFLEKAVYFWEDSVDSHYMDTYEGGYAKWIPGSGASSSASGPGGTTSGAADDGTYAVANFTNFQVGANSGSNGGGGSGTSANYTVNHSRRYAAIGQGFVLVSDQTTPNGTYPLVIDNSMRLYLGQNNAVGGNGAVFNKTAGNNKTNAAGEVVAMSHNGLDYQTIVNHPMVIPEIRMYTHINDSYYRENVIAFRVGTNETYSNQGTDGLLIMKADTDAYIMADGQNLSIKSIEYDIDARLPFGLIAGEASNNQFDVHVEGLKDTPSGMEMFIYDNVTDTYTDIINDTFSITLDQGTYNDRFEITFRESSAVLGVAEEEIAASFTVFQNNSAGSLMIKNPESYDVKAFTMYDIAGKLIYNKVNLGAKTNYSFPTTSLSTGTYLVKVITNDEVEITKKVIVHNK